MARTKRQNADDVDAVRIRSDTPRRAKQTLDQQQQRHLLGLFGQPVQPAGADEVLAVRPGNCPGGGGGPWGVPPTRWRRADEMESAGPAGKASWPDEDNGSPAPVICRVSHSCGSGGLHAIPVTSPMTNRRSALFQGARRAGRAKNDIRTHKGFPHVQYFAWGSRSTRFGCVCVIFRMSLSATPKKSVP